MKFGMNYYMNYYYMNNSGLKFVKIIIEPKVYNDKFLFEQ